MPPLITAIAEAVRDGKPVPAKAAGDVQRHNGPLVTIALQLADKLPGTGANGTFTHPAFMTNALAAALESLGRPLTDSQRTALDDLGRRSTAEDRDRIARYDERTFLLQKVVEEGDLRTRFFASLRALLSPEQLALVSPEVQRDRLALDVWSSGIFWIQFHRPASFTSQADLAEKTARTYGRLLKVAEGAETEKLTAIVADWASRLPETLREREVDVLERGGWPRAETVALAAAESRKLVERAAADLGLSGERLETARKIALVFTPTPGGDGE
jgi:hypothetical protein